MTLEKPKNQWAQSVRLLIENKSTGVTMADACKDFFYKFQSRLGEVEQGRKHKMKVRRLPITKKNRFGHTHTFTNYKSLAPMKYLVNLYRKLNKDGL